MHIDQPTSAYRNCPCMMSVLILAHFPHSQHHKQ